MSSRKYLQGGASAGLALLLLAVLVVLNYLSARHVSRRLDLTHNREFTVAPATRKLLAALDDVVTVKVYFSKDLPEQVASIPTRIRDLLAEFEAYGRGRLKIESVDPAVEPGNRAEGPQPGHPPGTGDGARAQQAAAGRRLPRPGPVLRRPDRGHPGGQQQHQPRVRAGEPDPQDDPAEADHRLPQRLRRSRAVPRIPHDRRAAARALRGRVGRPRRRQDGAGQGRDADRRRSAQASRRSRPLRDRPVPDARRPGAVPDRPVRDRPALVRGEPDRHRARRPAQELRRRRQAATGGRLGHERAGAAPRRPGVRRRPDADHQRVPAVAEAHRRQHLGDPRHGQPAPEPGAPVHLAGRGGQGPRRRLRGHRAVPLDPVRPRRGPPGQRAPQGAAAAARGRPQALLPRPRHHRAAEELLRRQAGTAGRPQGSQPRGTARAGDRAGRDPRTDPGPGRLDPDRRRRRHRLRLRLDAAAARLRRQRRLLPQRGRLADDGRRPDRHPQPGRRRADARPEAARGRRELRAVDQHRWSSRLLVVALGLVWRATRKSRRVVLA